MGHIPCKEKTTIIFHSKNENPGHSLKCWYKRRELHCTSPKVWSFHTGRMTHLVMKGVFKQLNVKSVLYSSDLKHYFSSLIALCHAADKLKALCTSFNCSVEPCHSFLLLLHFLVPTRDGKDLSRTDFNSM